MNPRGLRALQRAGSTREVDAVGRLRQADAAGRRRLSWCRQARSGRSLARTTPRSRTKPCTTRHSLEDSLDSLDSAEVTRTVGADRLKGTGKRRARNGKPALPLRILVPLAESSRRGTARIHWRELHSVRPRVMLFSPPTGARLRGHARGLQRAGSARGGSRARGSRAKRVTGEDARRLTTPRAPCLRDADRASQASSPARHSHTAPCVLSLRRATHPRIHASAHPHIRTFTYPHIHLSTVHPSIV